MDYIYAAEKFSAARSELTIPASGGELASIVCAFHECSLGLMNLDRIGIQDNDALNWLRKLDDLMNTSGLEDPDEKGLYQVKAESLSKEDKVELARVIDKLASWFCYVIAERP